MKELLRKIDSDKFPPPCYIEDIHEPSDEEIFLRSFNAHSNYDKRPGAHVKWFQIVWFGYQPLKVFYYDGFELHIIKAFPNEDISNSTISFISSGYKQYF